MTIQPGDFIPAVRIKYLGEGGMHEVATDELFGKGTSVLFGVPGCFTPTCSNEHIPSFTRNMAALKAKGVERVVCMGVNDPFVMHEWLKSMNVTNIVPLPDGNATLTKAMGLELDASAHGLGIRTKRFAAIIKDGKLVHLAIDKPGAVDEASGDAVLRVLSA